MLCGNCGATLYSSSFIGGTVGAMDATLRLHQSGKCQQSAAPVSIDESRGVKMGTSTMDAALMELADEAAESQVRRNAAIKIGEMRADAKLDDVARVVAHLANPHNCEVGGSAISVRRAALLAFTELARGPEGVPTVVASCAPAVVELLQHTDPDAREMAVRALGALGKHADAIALAARLEDEENDVRAAASDTLVVLRDTLGAPDLDSIASVLRYDGDDEVRAWALRTLGGIGPAAATQSAAVLACLHDEDTMALTPPSRAIAVATLAAFGRASAASHLPFIAAMLEDADEDACVRAAAVEALAQVGEAAIHGEAISELLGDRDRMVRNAATSALKRWDMY